MWQYILRRIAATVPVLLGVSLVIFAIMRIAPGDVASVILGAEGSTGTITEEQREALREELGLNKSYPVQYLEFVSGLVRLDPGVSLWTDRPVSEMIASRIGVTIELALISVIVSLSIAIPAGVLSAIYQDRWGDYLLRIISIAGLSVPNFWLGILTIIGLAYYFGWTPPAGYTSIFDDPVKNLKQIVLPALVLGYSGAAAVSRMTRSAMLEVLREDFVRTARAKGLRGWAVIMRHALRNALLPVITLSSLQLGNLLGGTVIVETIFSIPGVGRLLVNGMIYRDYPTVQTVVVLSAAVFVMVNLIVDLLYAWLDPRIRYV